MKHRTRDEHLFAPGPKRILALPGGGIRGVLTLEYLKRIEDILRERNGGDSDFRLCDYFDLIGGTSTGAMIAGALALGFPVAKIQAIYHDLADAVFQYRPWRLGIFSPKFSAEPLSGVLYRHFGDITFSSEELRTGIAISVKRADTGSPWLITNNPRGKYFAGAGDIVANRDYLLRQVIRASTAVPHFFEPERLEVAPGVEGVFLDGGAGTDANPALRMLMLATLQGYGLCWPFGPDKLLLVSPATGTRSAPRTADQVMAMPAAQFALQSLVSMVTDCDWLVQTILQWISDSPTKWIIDSEMGDLQGDLLAGRPLISFVRYNAAFEVPWIRDNLGIEITEDQAAGLEAMDNPKNTKLLAQVGEHAAMKQVQPAHFPAVFDIEIH